MEKYVEGLVSIVIPMLNEQDNVQTLLSRLEFSLKHMEYEVIIVDDGSTDNTANEVSKFASRSSRKILLISNPGNLGISKSWWIGCEASSGQYLCLIDGDLQNPPEYVPKMLAELNHNNVEIVQGVRSTLDRVRDYRFWMSKGLNLVLNVVFFQNAKDSKSGFLLGYKSILTTILKPINGIKYQQNFIGVQIRLENISVHEMETIFQPRLAGKSFLKGFRSFKASLEALIDIPKFILLKRKEYSGDNYLLQFSRPYKSELNLCRAALRYLYFATFPLHTWVISRRTKEFYFALKNLEYIDKAKLTSIQLERMQLLISHAFRTVPYYRRIMRELSIQPSDIGTIESLSKLPLLSKEDVRNNIHFDLFSSKHKKNQLHKISTSGSTGQPFICYADKTQLEIRFATTLRAYEMAGWKFGDKQTRLWHQKIGMNARMVFKEKLDALLMRRTFVPAYEMSADSVNELVNSLNRRKPVILDGYAESFNFISKANNQIRYRPRAIISSAQQLTDETRFSIQNKFNAKVIDKYGSREFSGIAYECQEGTRHHVQDESYIVEIIVEGRTAKPGEIGEIVITDLNNYSVPLIRYRIGDLAEAVEQTICVCGRPTSLIGKIVGRSQALVQCSNNVWLPGTFFAHFFKEYSHLVKHYQVVQEIENSFKVLIIPTTMMNDDFKIQILRALSEFTGDTEVTIELVNEIPLLATGKRTPVISKLNYDFQRLEEKNLLN